MAKQAFPDAKVGEKFNANFISYQTDAEKGEGIDVAKKYAVTAYPTSLYVPGNGELLHWAVGYGGISGILTEADKAIAAAKEPRPIAVWEKEYAAGKRDSTFLLGYLTKRASIGMPNGKALENYLVAIPASDWTADKNVEAISGNLTTTNTKAYQVLYNHMMKIRMANQPRYQHMMTSFRSASRADYDRAVASRDASQLEHLVANERRHIAAMLLTDPTPTELEQFAGMGFRMQFYKIVKDWSTYRRLAMAQATELMLLPMDSIEAKDKAAHQLFLAQTASTPDSIKNQADFKKYAEEMKHAEALKMAMTLNGLAMTYCENMTDPADLKQDLTWSTRMVELDPKPAFLDTHAQLLAKLGRKAEAAVVEQDALTKAKAAGEGTADYEKALAEMQKK